MKFKVGDKVIQDINGEMITATFTRYDERGQLWCLWDDDGKEARTNEDTLMLIEVYNSPLNEELN